MTETGQKAQRSLAKLGEFLVEGAANMITGGLITTQEFEARRNCQTTRCADGKEWKQFKDMEDGEKFDFLYTSGQQTQRDQLQNSIRMYGVKKNDSKGDNPTEILKRICKEGLNLKQQEVDLISTSALRFIQRVESGKCLVFQLNRVDLTQKIFEKIGNLWDYENPYNKNVKIVFTCNLCPEDNRIRSECLSVKELLKEKGFKDVKVRLNKVISVNGGPWHDYNWYLEDRYDDAVQREQVATERQGLPSTSGATTTGDRASYFSVVSKRKAVEQEQQGTSEQGSSPQSSNTEEQSTQKKQKHKRSKKQK